MTVGLGFARKLLGLFEYGVESLNGKAQIKMIDVVKLGIKFAFVNIEVPASGLLGRDAFTDKLSHELVEVGF